MPMSKSFNPSVIPERLPEPGEQYAFEIQMDLCTGCKSCVSACNSLNGLEEDETWRKTGLVYQTEPPLGLQTITSACHHCLEPACMHGCPVLAYDKNPLTGIVKHLDDQCIGCQYCTFTCPYGVPQWVPSKGIVRKCDLCTQRLDQGEAPACVQGCPNDAIHVVLVKAAEIRKDPSAYVDLPGTTGPEHTLPTTKYVGKKITRNNGKTADQAQVQIQPAHTPLALMLVGTQTSVGGFIAQLWAPNFALAITNLLLLFAALGVAGLHLGRPQYAFRVILGVRRSWLSREALLFGLFAQMAVIDLILSWRYDLHWFAEAVPVFGLLAVLSSARLYHIAAPGSWNWVGTFVSFLLTMTLASLAQMWISGALGPLPLWGLVPVSLLQLSIEASWRREQKTDVWDWRKRRAVLLKGPLSDLSRSRLTFGVIGGLLVPLLIGLTAFQLPGLPWVIPAIGLIFIVAGELISRRLFFKTAVLDQIPGE